jgi:hypothetical protein
MGDLIVVKELADFMEKRGMAFTINGNLWVFSTTGEMGAETIRGIENYGWKFELVRQRNNTSSFIAIFSPKKD